MFTRYKIKSHVQLGLINQVQIALTQSSVFVASGRIEICARWIAKLGIFRMFTPSMASDVVACSIEQWMVHRGASFIAASASGTRIEKAEKVFCGSGSQIHHGLEIAICVENSFAGLLAVFAVLSQNELCLGS